MNSGALSRFCSSALDFVDGLNRAQARFSISDGLRLQHFLAQCAHESAGFTRLEENLNYSTEGLLRTWPGRFATDAHEYAKHPEMIANRAYGGRLGNDPESSGDGWKYRGRGLIQITGKNNYKKASFALFGDDRMLENPDLAKNPQHAPLIAGWFWEANQCNALADRDDLNGITYRVNGGLNGIGDREGWLHRARECFPS